MNFLDLLFPKSCVLCKRQGSYICTTCLSKVELAGPVCPACKRFSIKGATHISCRGDTYLDGAVAIYKYEGVIRKAIIKFKYNFVSDIGKELLASLVSANNLGRELLQSAFFVPIPLHKKRFNWRGFNQAEVLSMGLSKALGTPTMKLLIRVEDGVHQATLDRESRLRNMRGKYAVNLPREALAKWGGRKVILVDDVWTTGSTLNEAARVLKEAGFKEVWGVTIAR